MRNASLLVAAIVASAPAAAFAEQEQSPSWTIGAGIGSIGQVFLITPSTPAAGLFGPGLGQSVPVATFFLERRVGERTWLVFGASGSVTRNQVDPPPPTGVAIATITKDDSERGSLSVGIRDVVTRPGAFVDVSIQATVEGGYLHEQQELNTPGAAASEIRDTGSYWAVTGGIAVERELTGGLAVRVSTPLLGTSWAKVARKDALGTRNGTSTSAFVTLAPRLELRLAF
jgi:hypothetical protein